MALAGAAALLSLVLGVFLATPAHAAPRAAAPAVPTAVPAAAQGHVTILVLDMSGSMGRPGQGGNDPDGLRCSAAHAYIDLSGPGQWIGLVGLSHPEGAPGSPESAQDYAQPAEMSTDAARAAMRRALDTQSNGCIGDGTTPMADALARADRMLQVATKGGKLSGSAILLTDGQPDPDPTYQIAAIHREQADFVARGWPIDTIALGDADRGFLQGVADATGGKAYDVAHGPVSGVSPLNLEPFFVDIFRITAGRTLLHAVPPTAITGATQRQFHVGRFISHIDVLVVRDSDQVGVQLYAPGEYPNNPIQPGQARIVGNDPHYAIFSVDDPIRGDWVLGFSGAGELLTDALLQSTLSLQLVSPLADQHLPIGLSLPLDAALRDGQNQVLAEPVTVSATLAPANGADQTGREVPLSDLGAGGSPTGNYHGSVTVPQGAPLGTYEVSLQARLNDAEVDLVVPVVFEPFPVPTLLSPADGKPQVNGLTVDAVPSAPLAVSFGLTVAGAPQDEPGVSATLSAGGQPIPLTPYAGTWQGTYIPATNGRQALVVQLSGSYHGTDLKPWTYTLPLSVTLRPSLAVSGLDARRPYPANRGVTITVAYFRQAGVPDPDAAGHITAILLPPGGIGIPLALQPKLNAQDQPQPGAFTATLPFGAAGTYTFHAIYDDGVAADHSEQLFVLRVIDFPTAVTAPMAPGERLTDWGVLGGVYSSPLTGWLSGLPLAGTPSRPTATLSGQVTLAGRPYTGGTVQAVAYAAGSSRPLPAEVTRAGAAYRVRFRAPAPGAYTVVTSWTGDFAGLRGDEEPTTDVLQVAIVGPDAGGWARAWIVTLLYLALLAGLAQLGRFGATPAPAGALQAEGRADDLYHVDQARTPPWRRFLWRNRVRTRDLGLPAGAELRFRRHLGPLVTLERGADPETEVLVGGTALRPGGAPAALEGTGLTFRQAAPDLDDAAGAGPSRGRRSARRDERDDELAASHYAYVSPAELRERDERDDPFAGLAAAAEASDPFAADAPRQPSSLLGHLGALLAALRPLPRAVEDDGLGDLWPADEEPGPRRARGGRRDLDAFDELDAGPRRPRAGAGRRGGRDDAFDDLDAGYGASGRRRGRDADEIYATGGGRRARRDAFDDDPGPRQRRRRRADDPYGDL